MLTFSKLGRYGNLGNQLFQIASTIGIAEKHKHSWFFPEWKYKVYFDYELPEGKADDEFIILRERKFKYHEWLIGDGNYDLVGWLQSELYFDTELTKKIFTFKSDFKRRLLEENEKLFTRKTILISVRRGDFVDHPKYFQLSFKYYILALIQHFPDWKERNLIFASDDIAYCQFHFGHFKNAFFLKDRIPIKQLLIGSNCDDFIISNSTFSWWIAWLGENSDRQVICPIRNFSEQRSEKDDGDYYPKRWIKYDHRNKSIPFRFTYLIIKGNLFQLKHRLKQKARRVRDRLITKS